MKTPRLNIAITCPKCHYGVLVCKPYKNGDWLETCTNCIYKQVRTDLRKYHRRQQPRHNTRDRRSIT